MQRPTVPIIAALAAGAAVRVHPSIRYAHHDSSATQAMGTAFAEFVLNEFIDCSERFLGRAC
ncbi:MAG: hypothetical protein O2782_17495 [bacterium]|nr:hypothetical protein [bacterium]